MAKKKTTSKKVASVKSKAKKSYAKAKKSYAKVKRTVSSNPGTSGLVMGAVAGLAVGYMIASK
jgi:F0F1-type ATP synthase assembly protein I